MDYGQHVGRGFGPAWRGVLFRRTYKQLEDIVQRSKRWYPRIFPGAKFNESEYHWTFPEGEELLLRYIWSKNDYENYHGHEYPYIGWEELSNWPTQECYDLMKSCSRSSVPGMPRKIRGTTNSYGVGHAWLKDYFISPTPPLVPVGPVGLQRTHVIMDLEQNAPFLEADPEYLTRLEAIEDENLRQAWRYGSWDIIAGAFFADVWNAKVQVIPPFRIPQNWRIDRSHDWGESRPFATLWFAESNGEEVETPQGPQRWPKGTLFVIAEDYGWNGKPNEGIRLQAHGIARRVKEAEQAMGYVVHPGPADLPAMQNGQSVEADMAQVGVRWEKPQKGPGSRVTGWSALRGRLAASLKQPMEEPGLFIFDTCRHVIRTVPVLPRDEKDLDDVDTEAEDHAADALRLRCAVRDMKMAVGRMRV